MCCQSRNETDRELKKICLYCELFDISQSPLHHLDTCPSFVDNVRRFSGFMSPWNTLSKHSTPQRTTHRIISEGRREHLYHLSRNSKADSWTGWGSDCFDFYPLCIAWISNYYFFLCRNIKWLYSKDRRDGSDGVMLGKCKLTLQWSYWNCVWFPISFAFPRASLFLLIIGLL